MKHFNNRRALTGNVSLVPKCLYNLRTICSGLEYCSFSIRLNSDSLELVHVDFNTREGRQGRCCSMATISHEEIDAIIIAVSDLYRLELAGL